MKFEQTKEWRGETFVRCIGEKWLKDKAEEAHAVAKPKREPVQKTPAPLAIGIIRNALE